MFVQILKIFNYFHINASCRNAIVKRESVKWTENIANRVFFNSVGWLVCSSVPSKACIP